MRKPLQWRRYLAVAHLTDSESCLCTLGIDSLFAVQVVGIVGRFGARPNAQLRAA